MYPCCLSVLFPGFPWIPFCSWPKVVIWPAVCTGWCAVYWNYCCDSLYGVFRRESTSHYTCHTNKSGVTAVMSSGSSESGPGLWTWLTWDPEKWELEASTRPLGWEMVGHQGCWRWCSGFVSDPESEKWGNAAQEVWPRATKLGPGRPCKNDCLSFAAVLLGLQFLFILPEENQREAWVDEGRPGCCKNHFNLQIQNSAQFCCLCTLCLELALWGLIFPFPCQIYSLASCFYSLCQIWDIAVWWLWWQQQ